MESDEAFMLYIQGKLSFEEFQLHKQGQYNNGRGSPLPVVIPTDMSGVSGSEAGPSSSHVTMTTFAPISTPDVIVTGVSHNPDVASVQVKTEPADYMPGELWAQSGLENESQELVETDPNTADIIPVDSESTMKYLKGEMSFAEYSTLLDQQEKKTDARMEDIPDLETDIEVSTATEEPEASASSQRQPSHKTAKGGERGFKSRLPPDMKGLMGEANMRFAHGEVETAIKMCMEVIRLAPAAAEPFQTLSMIYEEQGNPDKCLQFSLIAAHLRPADSEQWHKVAEMYIEINSLREAIDCYNKAIKYHPRNSALWWARCQLLEQVGDHRRALEGYQHIMDLLPHDNAEKFMQLARDMTKMFHANREHDKALAMMSKAFLVHPKAVQPGDVNLLLELYISTKVYDKGLLALVQFGGVELHYDDSSVIIATDPPLTNLPSLKPSSVKMVDEMPIDLVSKLMVCCIQLGYMSAVKPVEARLLQQASDDVGDLQLDAAEAYMERGQYREASAILHKLVASSNYNLAAVWLRYAECLSSLGDLHGAVDAYEHVRQLAPSHLGARIALSALQQQLGKHDEALAALEPHAADDAHEEEEVKIDGQLLLPKCTLLYSQKKWSEYIDCTKHLLYGHLQSLTDPSNLRVALLSRSYKHRVDILRGIAGPQIDAELKQARNVVTEESMVLDMWELFRKLCSVLVKKKYFGEMVEVCGLSLMQPHFMCRPEYEAEVDFYLLYACFMNKDGYYAYNFVREICAKNLNNNRAWNLFNQVVNMAPDFRHNRFCLRLMIKYPDHFALAVLNGHNAMVSGTFKHALGEYVSAFRQRPKDPLLSLLIGLVYIHMASQKFSSNRHSLVIQGMAFLNQYSELRGDTTEVYYNLGRAVHQLGLLHAAVHYYQKALACPLPVEGQQEDMFDLRREAAFNLHLIYMQSGSHMLAYGILQKYLVIS